MKNNLNYQHMATSLNTQLLSSMIKNKRGTKGLREVANEITGISAATLSRIEQGNLPDVETFILLCDWLEVSTDVFINGQKFDTRDLTEKDLLVCQLRASNELDNETIDAMVTMINLAFTKVKANVKK